MVAAMSERIETTILRNLLCNEQFYRKVVPFVKPDYFDEQHEKVIYEEVWNFASNYDLLPTAEVLTINLQNRKDLNDETYQNAIKTIQSLNTDPVEYNWLLDTTEKWCKDRAIYLALLESIKIADGGEKKVSKDAIPSIYKKPWQYRSMSTSVTTTSKTSKSVTTSTIWKKIRCRLTWRNSI
jgi:hypothetical protein